MALNVSDDPDYWRARAEEARSIAEQMAHHSSGREPLLSRRETWAAARKGGVRRE